MTSESAAERLQGLLAPEVLVAGLAQQRHVVAQLDAEVERGIDAERRTLRERQRVAVAQPDLEVGLGPNRRVQPREEVQVLHLERG